MLVGATENAVAGHIWPAGRYLPTPVLYKSIASKKHSVRYELCFKILSCIGQLGL